MKEIWKPIKGYYGLYEVSNLGRVRSLDRVVISKTGRNMPYKGRIKKTRNLKGYPAVGLHKLGKCKDITIHRLVAEAFVSGKKPGLQVNHKDGCITNNVYTNLEWVTAKENVTHSIETLGYCRKGRNNSNSKLNENDVKKIRKMFGKFTFDEIADKYNVCNGTIQAIKYKRLWRHV